MKKTCLLKYPRLIMVADMLAGVGRVLMNEKIIRQVGGCKVNITFSDSNPELKDEILWSMMENYKKRITEQADNDVKTKGKKKSA